MVISAIIWNRERVGYQVIHSITCNTQIAFPEAQLMALEKRLPKQLYWCKKNQQKGHP